MPRYLAGLDIGFQQDYTALLICEVLHTPQGRLYTPLHLERLPLPCTTPQVEALVVGRLLQSKAWSCSRDHLLVDVTGGGMGVFHTLQRTRLAPIGIWSRGGVGHTREGWVWKVAKLDLIYSAVGVVEKHHLRLDTGLDLSDTMVHELLAYRRHQDASTGNETMAAWRQKDHDDLVFALSMICWWGELLDAWQFTGIDMRKGLVPKPGRHASTPDHPPRPKPWGERTWADELPPPSSVDQRAWDQAKTALGEGTLDRADVPSPWTP